MNLDFKRSGETSVGSFSPESAKAAVKSQLGGLGLNFKTIKHISEGLDHGGNITGKEFNDIIDEAESKGLIDKWKAEKIKDAVRLPDSYNKQWQ